MKKSTVKGTNDYLPNEVELREFMQSRILETYKNHGFERISTPIIEDLQNLNKSEGGENLGLIFKVLKRGNKLSEALNSNEELADLGLRYDLTLPLTRYYANNKEKLMFPFKSIQIDRVYRAEQPQRGRLREFTQCDIDVIGNSSWHAEVELIDTTINALLNIGMNKFTIKINDRKLLNIVLLNIGFLENELEEVCILLDKIDKIGLESIREELLQKNYNKKSIEMLIKIYSNDSFRSLEYIEDLCNKDYASNISNIIEVIQSIYSNNNNIKISFDLSLVRGQGYYTGPVFEIVSDEFNGAIAGGGRYDNLIGKFTRENVPAVGFSIGFERIYSILSNRNNSVTYRNKRIAFIYNKSDNYTDVLMKAATFRKEYDISIFEMPKKLSKFLEKAKSQQYYGFYLYGNDDGIRELI